MRTLLILLFLVGCGAAPDKRPGGVTQAEADALNAAAARTEADQAGK